MKDVAKKRLQKVTANQFAFLDYIKIFIVERGRSPSRKELTAHFGWKSSSTTTEYMARLTDHGLIAEGTDGIKIIKWDGAPEAVEYKAQEKQRGPKKAFLWDTEKPEVKMKTKYLSMPWRKST